MGEESPLVVLTYTSSMHEEETLEVKTNYTHTHADSFSQTSGFRLCREEQVIFAGLIDQKLEMSVLHYSSTYAATPGSGFSDLFSKRESSYRHVGIRLTWLVEVPTEFGYCEFSFFFFFIWP